MAQPRQRRSPNNRDRKREEEERRKDAAATGAGAAGLVGGGIVGGAAGSVPGATTATAGAVAMVEGTKAQAALVTTITTALLALLALIATRRRAIMRERLGKHGIRLDDVDAALVEEDRLEGIYRRRAEKRISDGLKVAMRAPDASARAAGVDGVMRREQQYAWMRAAAAANRVLAAAEREQLRRTSPRGAYWSLGVRNQHTPDCLAMAGKFWPWSILNIVHPLLHTGCGCFLRSYGDALAAGLLTEGAMLSAADQARIAGPVIQHVRAEQDELERLSEEWTAEITLREKLADAGHDANVLAAAPYAVDELFERFDPDQPRWPKGHPRAGQWRPKISTIGGLERAKVLKGIQDELGEHMTKIGSLGVDGSDEKAVEIGKKVMGLVKDHGTVPAYEKRLRDLDASIASGTQERREKILTDALGIELTDEDRQSSGVRRFIDGWRQPGAWEPHLKRVMEKHGKELTPDQVKKLADGLEKDWAKASADFDERAKVQKDLQLAHRDALLSILGTQREMGGSMKEAGVERSDFRLLKSQKKLGKATAKHQSEIESDMAEALKRVPADWLTATRKDGGTLIASGAMPEGTGAFHTSLKAATPGNTTGRDVNLIQMEGGKSDRQRLNSQSMALHEFMHRVELIDHHGDGPLADLGARWRDTNATGTGQLPGYPRSVKGRIGPWRDSYTGRIYPGDQGRSHNEVLSTGSEALWFPSRQDLSEPDDLVYWTAGVYAAY